ncbi:sugar transferase [Clostridium sp. 'White wine YQ']|uniref:sugar transferase n=1 Tax=Clostridium sp. 'White wine YQ' TaxID=3027474 RepID=UPI002365DEE3|nr:sugar transferase [Clostridium sp. 'White wine YQ']MDD7792768.1 sugar transferase [Clostridium sp. 'White wine YQ']
MKIYIMIKRMVDFLLSLIALILLSPLFLIIGILIKIDSPGPILFKQRRIGKNKKEFLILKFRTMRGDTPKDMPTHLFKNSENFITKSGKMLRSTSLDELPQLINIIKGEMSIIGPRPALWNQFDLIEERDKYGANDIIPGLTGWAQINGRDTISIEDKARYDGDYVKNLGFKMDARVFTKTIGFVLKRVGIVEGGTEMVEYQQIHTTNETTSTSDTLGQ